MSVRFDLLDLCSDGVKPRRCRPRALLAAILLPASLALLLDSTPHRKQWFSRWFAVEDWPRGDSQSPRRSPTRTGVSGPRTRGVGRDSQVRVAR